MRLLLRKINAISYGVQFRPFHPIINNPKRHYWPRFLRGILDLLYP